MNLKYIREMAEIDHVDGVFIDECSDFPDQSAKDYLKMLTDLAHSYGLLTWGNVGVSRFDSWYFSAGGFDLMQSDENWQSQPLSQVQQDWGYRISVAGSNPKFKARDALRLTLEAGRKGLAFCYIHNQGYDSLDPGLEEYARLLRTH